MWLLLLGADLSDHIEDADDTDEEGSVGLWETPLDGIVCQIDVRHIVPSVQQEIGDGEQQESQVGEVRKVQHVGEQVPKFPQTGRPLPNATHNKLFIYFLKWLLTLE